MFPLEYNMNKFRPIISALSICALVGFITILSHMGYGHHITQGNLNKSIYTPKPTRLAVIYERTLDGKNDFLHLKIDTTYHTRGKNGYCYEVFCDHKISLYAFDGAYTDLNATNAACFIESSTHNSHKWIKTHEKKSILGYECLHALMNDGNISWEAWYSDALPHAPNLKRINSPRRGVILASCNSDNSYSIKARYIRHTTI